MGNPGAVSDMQDPAAAREQALPLRGEPRQGEALKPRPLLGDLPFAREQEKVGAREGHEH